MPHAATSGPRSGPAYPQQQQQQYGNPNPAALAAQGYGAVNPSAYGLAGEGTGGTGGGDVDMGAPAPVGLQFLSAPFG